METPAYRVNGVRKKRTSQRDGQKPETPDGGLFLHKSAVAVPEKEEGGNKRDDGKKTGSGTSEIDFLLEHQGNIIPIEAKAERNLQAKSLKFYCQKFRPELAVRTSMSHYYLQQVAVPSAKDGVPDGHYTLMDIPLYGIHQFGK